MNVPVTLKSLDPNVPVVIRFSSPNDIEPDESVILPSANVKLPIFEPVAAVKTPQSNVDVPILIAPKPDVIEPLFNVPTVVN